MHIRFSLRILPRAGALLAEAIEAARMGLLPGALRSCMGPNRGGNGSLSQSRALDRLPRSNFGRHWAGSQRTDSARDAGQNYSIITLKNTLD